MDPPKERVRLTEHGVDFQLYVVVGLKVTKILIPLATLLG